MASQFHSLGTTPSVDSEPTLATVADTAKKHGIPVSTMYELFASGTAPGAVRIGRRILVHRQVFTAWLEQQAKGGVE